MKKKNFFMLTVILFIGMNLNAQTVKDIDGYDYKIVTIGTQTWLAENLNVSHFRNGDPIPEAKTTKDWKNALKNKQPVWSYYKNDSVKGNSYGKLYNWYTVSDPRGLAPEGWHIPSDNEWTLLTDYLGGEKLSGKKMKTKDGWIAFSINKQKFIGNGTDEIGFSAVPAGFFLHSSIKTPYGLKYPGLVFEGAGYTSYWWSSTESKTDKAWGRSININPYISSNDNMRIVNNVVTIDRSLDEDMIHKSDFNKGCGFSVRLLKDSD